MNFIKNNLLFILIFAMFVVIIGMMFYFNSCNKTTDNTALRNGYDSLLKANSEKSQTIALLKYKNITDSLLIVDKMDNIYSILNVIANKKVGTIIKVKEVLKRPRQELDSLIKKIP